MKTPTLIIALALAGMNNATAIGITLDRIQFEIGSTQLEFPTPFSGFVADNLTAPYENPNYHIEWSFANTQESASLEGFSYVRGDYLSTGATLLFTLTQAVNFLVTGGLHQGDWLPEAFTSLSAALGPYASSTSVLDIGRPSLPSLSGILNPGQYLFAASGFAYATESDSHVKLLLTPVATPDGGSTLMLLGLVLGILGIYDRRIIN